MIDEKLSDTRFLHVQSIQDLKNEEYLKKYCCGEMVFINKKRHINYRLRLYLGSSKEKERSTLEHYYLFWF